MVFDSQQEYDKKMNDLLASFGVGSLVENPEEIYGIAEECFFPENANKTIHFYHNVRIPAGTLGIVIGHYCIAGVLFVSVCWSCNPIRHLVVHADKIATS